MSFFGWWYGRGFSEYLSGFANKLRDAADFFSMGLLVKSLFAPFRQIAAEKHENMPLNARIHAWFDLQISRFVGATVRFGILIAGTIFIAIRAAIGIAIGILWPLMPLLLVYTVLLFLRGVVF